MSRCLVTINGDMGGGFTQHVGPGVWGVVVDIYGDDIAIQFQCYFSAGQ
jgi:hypothetical protein